MIKISKRANGGFSITHGSTFHVSYLDYCSTGETIKLILPLGSPLSLPEVEPNLISVENCILPTIIDLCNALDSIGAGYKGMGTPAQHATGTITLDDQPEVEDTITLDDGTNDALVFEFGGVIASGAIEFEDETNTAGNPEDGDTITFDSGGEDEIIFEFDDDDDVTEGAIAVTIGEDEDETMVNFIAAFNANVIGFTAYPTGTPDHKCTIKAVVVGADYNVTIAKSGDNITVAGMADGADADVTPGNVAVKIGLTVTDTLANLIEAINQSTSDGDLNIAATQLESSPFTTAKLWNLTAGASSNETITRSGTNITVSRMEGRAGKVSLESVIEALSE